MGMTASPSENKKEKTFMKYTYALVLFEHYSVTLSDKKALTSKAAFLRSMSIKWSNFSFTLINILMEKEVENGWKALKRKEKFNIHKIPNNIHHRNING